VIFINIKVLCEKQLHLELINKKFRLFTFKSLNSVRNYMFYLFCSFFLKVSNCVGFIFAEFSNCDLYNIIFDIQGLNACFFQVTGLIFKSVCISCKNEYQVLSNFENLKQSLLFITFNQ